MSTNILVEKDDSNQNIILVQLQQGDDEGHWVNIGEPEALSEPFSVIPKVLSRNQRLVIKEKL